MSIIVGLLLAGIFLFVYRCRYVTEKHRNKPNPQRSFKVSCTRLYGRYKEIMAALEEAVREKEARDAGGVCPEERQKSRRSQRSCSLAKRDLPLYHFCNAIPAALVEELDRLKPSTLTAAKRTEGTRTTTVQE